MVLSYTAALHNGNVFRVFIFLKTCFEFLQPKAKTKKLQIIMSASSINAPGLTVSTTINTSNSKPGLTAITGPSANGKTTLRRILYEALVEAGAITVRVMQVDASDIIRWAIKNTHMKDIIVQHQDMMNAGWFLPDEVMIPVVTLWLEKTLAENPDLDLLIASGLPRTVAQHEAITRFFDPNRTLIVSVDISKKGSFDGMKRRAAQSNASGAEARTDDAGGDQVYENRWESYQTQTKPMLAGLGSMVQHLDYQTPLIQRVQKVLTACYGNGKCSIITNRQFRRAIGKLKDPTHWVHQEINHVEQGTTVTAIRPSMTRQVLATASVSTSSSHSSHETMAVLPQAVMA